MCYANYREGLSGLVLVQNGKFLRIPERGIEPRAATNYVSMVANGNNVTPTPFRGQSIILKDNFESKARGTQSTETSQAHVHLANSIKFAERPARARLTYSWRIGAPVNLILEHGPFTYNGAITSQLPLTHRVYLRLVASDQLPRSSAFLKVPVRQVCQSDCGGAPEFHYALSKSLPQAPGIPIETKSGLRWPGSVRGVQDFFLKQVHRPEPRTGSEQ
ncbi:hypothetical protein GGX14DRAFT_395641 [Mycena pura]|uniref:Uncharacterized protein n=1 Tax=Mycena pura TaxID=153505 RepID=A0AAD6VCS8_9AGAR|nr:hypothetical protein GGX14DRAFT_395641 [Mycena pura]